MKPALSKIMYVTIKMIKHYDEMCTNNDQSFFLLVQSGSNQCIATTEVNIVLLQYNAIETTEVFCI